MQMHTHQTRNIVHPNLDIHGTDLEAVKNCKLLGVMISDTMNWLPQCEQVANKLRSVTYLFTILREIQYQRALSNLSTMHTPKVKYCIQLLSGALPPTCKRYL
jgi:hypothetical protein